MATAWIPTLGDSLVLSRWPPSCSWSHCSSMSFSDVLRVDDADVDDDQPNMPNSSSSAPTRPLRLTGLEEAVDNLTPDWSASSSEEERACPPAPQDIPGGPRPCLFRRYLDLEETPRPLARQRPAMSTTSSEMGGHAQCTSLSSRGPSGQTLFGLDMRLCRA